MLSPGTAMQERLQQLFVLNLCLQIFDGIATYQGLQQSWREGNPLLVASMPYLGTGTTLLLFKAKACGFLVLLRRCGERSFVYESMVALATVYGFFSFLPWMSRLLTLLVV
jgi:hypothetical protein